MKKRKSKEKIEEKLSRFKGIIREAEISVAKLKGKLDEIKKDWKKQFKVSTIDEAEALADKKEKELKKLEKEIKDGIKELEDKYEL